MIGMGEGFNEFYDKFHQDSLYQIAHIRFPLAGAMADTDSLTYAQNPNPWTMANWRFQQKPDLGGAFNQTIEASPVLEGVVVETLVHLQTGLKIMRRFYRDPNDKEWYLIYYADLNSF